MVNFLSINGTDVSYLVKGLRVGYETLVSEDSGRNANGDTVIDIINRKVKLYVSFRPMFDYDMKKLLATFNDYVVNISFLDSKTGATRTITCYTGTPEPEWYNIKMRMYKQMDLNFIEL